jgi:RNA recognition motif-containing protein
MKIFVANLNYGLKEEKLKDLFESYGDVSSVNIVTDRNTGRSKGFGFVEMPNDSEAANAIEALNNTEFDGRNLVAKESEDRPQKPRFTGRRP